MRVKIMLSTQRTDKIPKEPRFQIGSRKIPSILPLTNCVDLIVMRVMPSVKMSDEGFDKRDFVV